MEVEQSLEVQRSDKVERAGEDEQIEDVGDSAPPPLSADGVPPGKGAQAESTAPNASKPVNGAGGNKRKRSRRKHKAGKHHNRKWKPYDKLTWDERKVLDERETRRANLKREELFAAGQPMAPYNTTQFLMEQHQGSYDRLDMLGDTRTSRPHTRDRDAGAEGADGGSGSLDSSEEWNYDSADEDEEYLMGEKDFAEAYENYHAERLHSLSKEELVREYLELEAKTENLEKRLKQLGQAPPPTGEDNSVFPDNSNMDVDSEIERLKAENAKLARENDLLKNGPKSV